MYDEYHLGRLQSLNPKPFSISFFVNFGLKNIGTVAIFGSAGGVLFSYGDYHGRGPRACNPKPFSMCSPGIRVEKTQEQSLFVGRERCFVYIYIYTTNIPCVDSRA